MPQGAGCVQALAAGLVIFLVNLDGFRRAPKGADDHHMPFPACSTEGGRAGLLLFLARARREEGPSGSNWGMPWSGGQAFVAGNFSLSASR